MKLSLVKSVAERQTERAEKQIEIDNIKAELGKANSVQALRAQVEKLTEMVEALIK